MSVRIDWEVEAEGEQIRDRGEDPERARARRRARARLIAFTLFVILVFGGAAGAVVLRLRQVNDSIESVLRDTVAAEIATLRLGDREAFLLLQRSATDDWLIQQGATFSRYQALKQTADLNLTGRIDDLQIDGQRGRVRVEEIISGAAYERVWFYWRYEDGWHHVPPDYTFWGDPAMLEAPGALVRYRTFDQPAAQVVSERLSQWAQIVCAVAQCDASFRLTAEIIPDDTLTLGWSPADPTTLLIPSPYVDDARVDQLFSPSLQTEAAEAIAATVTAQMTDGLTPQPNTDAAYLLSAAQAWLSERMLGTQVSSPLIESLAARYGAGAVGGLLAALEMASDMRVLNTAAGTTSLEQTGLDWRDLLTWRLAQEGQAISRRDQAAYLLLYDPAVTDLALGRFTTATPTGTQTVVSVSQGVTEGVPELRALVQTAQMDGTTADAEILFRLIEGVWRRAS